MTRNIIRTATAIFLILSPPVAMAQEAKPARVGIFRTTVPPALNLAAFRDGMRDRGHVEGKTYVIVPGWSKQGDKREKDSVLADKLVARGVDIIVSVGSRRALEAMTMGRDGPSMPAVQPRRFPSSWHRAPIHFARVWSSLWRSPAATSPACPPPPWTLPSREWKCSSSWCPVSAASGRST